MADKGINYEPFDRENFKEDLCRHYLNYKEKMKELRNGYVINYYGISGVGKTTLSRVLLNELNNKMHFPLSANVQVNATK